MSLKAVLSIATDVTIAWSVHLCVCVCVHMCVVCHPAKAVRWNEVSFDRDIFVWSQLISNRVLDGRIPFREGRFAGRNPQFTVMPPIRQITLVVVF